MPKIASVQMMARSIQPAGPRSGPTCKRRAGARDKKIDRAVIDHLQNVFASRLRPQVIKRRSEIQDENRHRKDERSDKKRRVTSLPGNEKQKWYADHRGDQSKQVADGIGQLFAERLRPLWRQFEFVGQMHVERAFMILPAVANRASAN